MGMDNRRGLCFAWLPYLVMSLLPLFPCFCMSFPYTPQIPPPVPNDSMPAWHLLAACYVFILAAQGSSKPPRPGSHGVSVCVCLTSNMYVRLPLRPVNADTLMPTPMYTVHTEVPKLPRSLELERQHPKQHRSASHSQKQDQRSTRSKINTSSLNTYPRFLICTHPSPS